jgi:hypothetical protein
VVRIGRVAADELHRLIDRRVNFYLRYVFRAIAYRLHQFEQSVASRRALFGRWLRPRLAKGDRQLRGVGWFGV